MLEASQTHNRYTTFEPTRIFFKHSIILVGSWLNMCFLGWLWCHHVAVDDVNPYSVVLDFYISLPHWNWCLWKVGRAMIISWYSSSWVDASRHWRHAREKEGAAVFWPMKEELISYQVSLYTPSPTTCPSKCGASNLNLLYENAKRIWALHIKHSVFSWVWIQKRGWGKSMAVSKLVTLVSLSLFHISEPTRQEPIA